MKKIMISIVMLIALFAMTTVSAEAQCPPGFTPHTAYVTINGCEYEVQMCVKCPYGTAPGEGQIQSVTKLDVTCYQSLGFQQVLDAIEAHVFNWDYINNLCLNLPGPPCPEQSVEFIIRHWICWKSELIEYFGEQSIYYAPCDYDGARCVEQFTVCFNGTDYVKTYTVAPSIEGEINCTLEAWEVDEPDELWEVSPCYIIHTICNQ